MGEYLSALLMKTLNSGHCTVRNTRNGQIRVYWTEANLLKHVDIDANTKPVNLALSAPIDCLRKSKWLRSLVHDGHLVVVPNPS